MPHFRVYPSWHPGSRSAWTGPPCHSDLCNKLHAVRTSGLNICLGTPLPRVADRDELRILCRNVCLQCRLIDCEAHPEGSGLALAADASSVSLDVTDATLLAAVTEAGAGEEEPICHVVRESLVEQLELEPSPPRLATEVHLAENAADLPGQLGQCLFCGLGAADDHSDCPVVEVEQRDLGAALVFRTAHDAHRWRSLRGDPAEVVRLQVAALPTWQAQACRCCGRRAGTAQAFSPLRAEDDRKLLIFRNRAHAQRWRVAHADVAPAALADLIPHPEGFAQRLEVAAEWVGGCRCCGRILPASAGGAGAAPHVTLLPAGDATLLFGSQESAEAWRVAHPETKTLTGRLKRRLWVFGPAQLLPLLRTMKDFSAFRNLEVACFSQHHVVRSVEGCSARETSGVVQLGTKIWKLRWAQCDTHVHCVPRVHHNVGRLHLRPGEPGALVGASIDGKGRRRARTLVRQGEEVARYDMAGQIDSLLVPHAGDFEISWEEEPPPHLVDVLYLRQVVPPARAQAACKERLAVQKDLARLRLEAVEGNGGDPKSATEIAEDLLSGRRVARGTQGTLRAQAETVAHIFHAGPDRPRCVVSTADALFMRVLRRYRASREDHQALLRGPRQYPGSLQVRWQRGGQSGVLPVRRGGYAPADGWEELRASSREAKLEECYRVMAAAAGPLTLGQLGHDLHGSSIEERLTQLALALEASGHHRLGRLARSAMVDDRVLMRELRLQRVRAWCDSVGVTHLVAHPVDEDCYYCGRNPFDNSGSAQCVTVKVVPGTSRGAGFSALLLERYGMDYDGDHANLVAVLDVLSAEVQEARFGPEHRQFMETGRFVGGPTAWPLERWNSLLEGEELHLPRDTALAILAAAGTAATLEPPWHIREEARHAPGTPLVVCESFVPQPHEQPVLPVGARCFAAAPRPGDPPTHQAVYLDSQRGRRALCHRGMLWRSQISGADIMASLLSAVLPPGRVLRLQGCGREIWRGGRQVWGGALFSLQVPRRVAKGWERLALRAYDEALAGRARLGMPSLAQELAANDLDMRGRRLLVEARRQLDGPTPPRDAAALTSSIWAQCPSPRGTSLLAAFEAAMASSPWEARVAEIRAGTFALPSHRCLPLAHRGEVRLWSLAQALARRRWFPDRRRNALARWRPAIPLAQAALHLPAALAVCLLQHVASSRSPHVALLAAEECGLGEAVPTSMPTESPPLGDGERTAKRARTMTTARDSARWQQVQYPRAARANWARLLVCIRGARNMPSLDRPTVTDILTAVARDVGLLSALDLATKLQTTGYRIGTAPALLARSDEAPPPGAQPLVEACVDAFNHLWDCQHPLPCPRPAGGAAQMRHRALADPVRSIFSSLARGLGPTPPCERCEDCDARQLVVAPSPTPLGRKILAAATRPAVLREVVRGDVELEGLLASRPSGAAAARKLARFDARRSLADSLLAALEDDDDDDE